MNALSWNSAKCTGTSVFQAVSGCLSGCTIVRFDLDNSLKTLLDCLQMVGAIEDDKLCFQIEAEKKIDKFHPRIEFALLEVNEQKQLFY
jgi:Holliday junction resolvase RusA-like endonuclease